ncbi:hypothetical protein ACA910_015293 [Epithemia clementina (nom. ined.)]
MACKCIRRDDRLSLTWRFLLFLPLFLIDISVNALSVQSPKSGVLSGLLGGLEGPGYNFLPPPPMQPRAKALLEKLNLQASLEPVLAKVPPSEIFNLLSATVPTLIRGASGFFGLDYQLQWIPRDDTKYAYIATKTSQLQETCFAKSTAKPIIFYDVESNPECRRVREACSILSLTLHVRPVPRGGRQFRSELKQHGASDAPCIFDPNTGVAVTGADRINSFLFTTYGNGEVPRIFESSGNDNGPFSWQTVSSTLAVGLARLNAGGSSVFSNPPPRTIDGKPALTLWAYEGSPFCKVVAETMSSLELEHNVIYTPRGSPNRALLWRQVGRFQVPYLEDAHTGVSLFESTAIVEYLQKQYSIAPSPVQFM